MTHFWFFSQFKALVFFGSACIWCLNYLKPKDISHLNILTCRDKFMVLSLEITSEVTAGIWLRNTLAILRYFFFWSSFQIHKIHFCLLLNAIFTWTKGFYFILKSTSRLFYSSHHSKSLAFLFQVIMWNQLYPHCTNWCFPLEYLPACSPGAPAREPCQVFQERVRKPEKTRG